MKKELEKILEDQEFVKKVMLAKTKEDAKKIIEEKGVSVTDEEMNEIHDFYSAIYEECKKMKKEDLMNVSGGGKFFGVNGLFGPKGFDLGHGIEISGADIMGFFKKYGVETLVGLRDLFRTKSSLTDEEQKLKKHLAEMEEQKLKQADEELKFARERWEHNKNMQTAGLGAAALLAIVYMFRDDLKTGINKFGAWINS